MGMSYRGVVQMPRSRSKIAITKGIHDIPEWREAQTLRRSARSSILVSPQCYSIRTEPRLRAASMTKARASTRAPLSRLSARCERMPKHTSCCGHEEWVARAFSKSIVVGSVHLPKGSRRSWDIVSRLRHIASQWPASPTDLGTHGCQSTRRPEHGLSHHQ